MNNNDTVTIDRREHERLLFIEANFDALEAAGVDNWDHYSEVEWPDEEHYFTEG